MRTLLKVALLAAAAYCIVSCENTPEPQGPSDCPGPISGPYGYIFPEWSRGFGDGVVSIDGKFLAAMNAYGRIVLIDLHNGNHEELPRINLPANVALMYISGFAWCPYQPDRLVITAGTSTDTSGHGNWVLGVNAYIIDIRGKVIERVTPSVYPAWGAESGSGINNPKWLYGSNVSADSLLFYPMLYVPQERKTVHPVHYKVTQSRDGRHWFGHENVEGGARLINGLRFTLDGYPPADGNIAASFSPSGRFLALRGWSNPPTINTPNVWIIDMEMFLEDPSKTIVPVAAINTQRDYCMFFGIDPVFITDSTLLISMHKATGADNGYHEIGIDGRYIRKFTRSY
jgi:hypothetical protein